MQLDLTPENLSLLLKNPSKYHLYFSKVQLSTKAVELNTKK